MTFIEILEEFNVPYSTDGSDTTDGWVQLWCPFCHPGAEKKYLGFNLAGGYLHCWFEGFIRLENYLKEVTNLPYSEIRKLVGEIPKEFGEEKVWRRGRLVLPEGLTELMSPHKSYLKFRGFDPAELQKKWGIKGIGLASSLAWRIFIPIHYRGEVVSYTTRSLTNDEPRYISAKKDHEIYDHKQLLFGEDQVRHTAIVCEGCFDVFKIGYGAVCTFGVSLSQGQILRISRFPRRIIVADTEKIAQNKARDLCNQLKLLPGETIKVVLDSKDPGVCNPKELKMLRSFLN